MKIKDYFINRKNAKKTMIMFAEGKITTYEFWNEFLNDKILRNIIYKDRKLPIKNKPFLYEDINLESLIDRSEIYRVVKVYFLRRGKKLNFYNSDSELYSCLLNIVPDYIDISCWMIDNLVNKSLFELKSKLWKNDIRNRIKLLYTFEVFPPKWLQAPEWPIVNDKPCKFIKQTGNPNDISTDEIYYYFLDETNNQEIVVHQFI